jgi:hypothetical protein
MKDLEKEIKKVLTSDKARQDAGLPLEMRYKELIFCIESLLDSTVSEGRKS